MKRLLSLLMAMIFMFCLVSAGTPVHLQAANPNVGYPDFTFGNAPGEDATADKPQSKLWFNDGRWWAVMYHTGSSTWRIYKLNWPSVWEPTSTVVDTRPTSRADALWDSSSNKLYIASLVRLSASNQGLLSRFSYNAATATYTLDSGFPVTIMTGSAETLAIDKDSTGQFWITYTQGNKVYVNRSTTDAATWGTPFVIPGPTTATNVYQDDIASLVAYQDQNGPSIGVVWSNHNTQNNKLPSAIYFAAHKDSDADDVWQTPQAIYSGICAADDHINLKSLQADASGAIYAAIKTSLGDSGCGGSSASAQIRLVVRKPDNSWSWTTFGTVANDHTRPLVLLDTTNRKVYMFATSPTSCGIIYMKSTSMDNPDFSDQPGKGTPFISSSTYTCINNATSTKQTINASTGMVVMASDESGKRFYLHNAVAIGAPPPDTTAPTVTNRLPAANATNVATSTGISATFSEAVSGVTTSSMTLTAPGAAPVAATVSYDAATRTATLTPSTALNTSTIYTVALSSAIADAAGNPLAPVSWSFATAAPPPDTTAPTVIAASPASGASGVAATAPITATFSEALKPATVNTSSVTLVGPGQTTVPASVTYDAASKTLTLQPSAQLALNTTYTVRLSAALTDLAGNALVPVSWSFTSADVPPDTTPPTVSMVTPANNAIGIAMSAQVTATFSEPISSATFTSANFTLRAGSVLVAAQVSYDGSTRTATLVPTAPLIAGTTYTATLSGVKDLAGNALAAPVTWAFSTIAPAPNKLLVFLPVARGE